MNKRETLIPIVTADIQTPIYAGECIALIIQNNLGEILIVQENHPHEVYGRQHNQWNIVTETCESEDANFRNATIAAFLEEVSERIQNFHYFTESYKRERCWYQGFQYVRHGGVFLFTGDSNNLSPIDVQEINGYAWATISQLKELDEAGELEKEVLPFVLGYFQGGYLMSGISRGS